MNSNARAIAWRWFLLCCFAAIFGVRVYFVERYGGSVARVDEWEATGKEVLAAWEQGTFSLEALFQAHNGDHRIVATRLWEIFWYEVNGAWDPKLIMIVKSLIYALAGTLFTNVLVNGLPRRRFIAAGVLAALFAFPFGYQNLLWAFQSQFDFFLLAAALGWTALLWGRPVLALVIALLAPFTLGAGAIIAASYLLHACIKRLNGEWSWRGTVCFAAVAVAIAAFGVSLRADHAAPLGDPGEQAFTALKLFAWPASNLILLVSQLPESLRLIPAAVVNFPSADASVLLAVARLFQEQEWVLVLVIGALAMVMVFPIGVLATAVIKERRVPPCAWGPLCIGGFACLLQLASAIARSDEVLVQTRYIDTVALTGLSSAGAAIVLLERSRKFRRSVAIWALIVAPGYVATMGASVKQMGNGNIQNWIIAVRAYFPSHDRSVFPENTNWQLPILEKDPTAFANLLDDPHVIAILPRSIVDPANDPQPLARMMYAIARWGLAIMGVAAMAGVWIARRYRRVANAGPLRVRPGRLAGAHG